MRERPATQSSGPERRPLPERRARERRVLYVGLLVSAAIHLIVLGLAGGWLEPDPEPARAPDAIMAEPPAGMRAIEIAAEPAADRPRPPEEPEEPEREREAEPEAAAEVARAEPAGPADTLSAADRLAPRVVDPRLWEPMVILPLEPTLDDVEARVGAAIELMSDSALAAAEAAVRARDWTVEDASGGRWGISPGQIHLGKVSLPLPIWIPLDVEADLDQQRWYGLERDLERARILESFEERVKAIRERRDRERTERMEAEEAEPAEEAENGG
ncbi:MAG: hypothetical protein R3314_01565 [Longimicrobiales bacterium]|nr:hypothetical protein [Longimicrobiales bacterium]